MPRITTTTAVTTIARRCCGLIRTGIVYRPGRPGQIDLKVRGLALVLLFMVSALPLMAAIPVLDAANGAIVRPVGWVQESTTNDSTRPVGIKDSWRKSLQSRLSVQWQQVELKQIVTQANWPGVTLWCDRRVDTSRVIDLEIQTQPLQQVVQALAEYCESGLVIHGGVVALVPKEHATTLPVVLADARRQALELPANVGRPWLEPKERKWPTLVQPNSLLAEWLERVPKNWTIAELPHDVWDAGQLPQLPLIEQIAIVSFGFGLRPVLSTGETGPRLSFEAIRSDMSCAINLDDAFLRSELRKLKADFADRYPTLTARFDGNPQISGPLAELGVLLATLEAQRPQAGGPSGESRYTIKLDGQPAETVIRFLAQQIKREVTFEPALPEANLAKPIKLDADQWTLEELVRKIGQQCELQIQIDATRLHVRRLPNE